MPLHKSPGPPLTSIFKGLLEAVPQRWRARLGFTQVSQEQPTDVDPALNGDPLHIVSDVTQERTDERLKKDVTLGDPSSETMIEYLRTEEGQVATRTVRYIAEGTAAPSISELFKEFSQDARGDGYSEQITTTVPNLFGALDYSVERPDRVPPDFGALLRTIETGTTVAGTAALPVLGLGELMREEKQLTVQTKRVTVRYRDLSLLPLTIIDKKTNPDKQVVSVTRIWELDSVTPAVPTAIQDVEFTKLGDGTALEERLGVPNVFGGQDYTRERPDRTPPDFGALLEIEEFVQIIAGTAADPTLLTGELSREEKQVTEFTKQVTIKSRDIASLPITIINLDTDKDKQVVTITRIWDVDSVTPATPDEVTDVKFELLGDGTAIQTVEGVPEVFLGTDVTIERPDRLPAEFASAIQIEELVNTIVGTVTTPTLFPGELMRREVQVNEFSKRVTVRGRILDSLPITFRSYDTGRDKEVITIDRTWQLDSVPAIAPTSTTDTTWDNLNDGTAIQTVRAKAVFPGPVYSKSIENLIPPKFRANIPTLVSEISSAGTANSNPTLGAGELTHEEQQVDVFNIRVKSVVLDAISPPITFTDEEISAEFGGGVLDVVYTLATSGSLTIDTGLLVVSSELTDLGNGFEIKTTKELQDSEWAELEGTEVDPRTGIVVDVKKKVVVAGTLGGVDVNGYTDIKPLDVWRSIQIVSKLDIDSIPGTATWETTVEHAFPNTLTAARFIWAYAATDESADFDLALLLNMTQGYAGPCRAKITESFSDGPPIDTVAITEFFPEGHMVGFAWFYANSDSGIARANARTFSISPSLHGDLDLGLSILIAGTGAARTVTDGVLSFGTNIVQSATAAFTTADVGASIEGTGIPTLAVILSIDSPTQARMSQNAYLTGGSISLTITQGTFHGTETLSATNPSGLPASGTLITKDVNVERWRFGIFFRRITEIYVP